MIFFLKEPILVETVMNYFDYISSIGLPVIAIILSLLAMHFEKKHNRQSVKPLAHILLDDSPDGLSIKLINKGLGPMIIEDFIAEDKYGKKENNIYYHLPKFKENRLFSFQYHTKPINYIVSKDEELSLLEIKGNITNKDYMDFKMYIRNILKDLTITIKYTDVYDKRMKDYKKEFTYFARIL
jgi:hypothetical protein